MADYNIWHIYDEMEKHLIASMSRNLMRHEKEEKKVGVEYEQWQAAKLRELRKFRKQNQKIIGKHTKNLPKEIKQHLENEYKQGLVGQIKKHKELFGDTSITKDLSEGFFSMNDKKIQALIEAVNNDLAKANQAALRMINDTYRRTIHRAAMFAANGVMTEKQATQLAIDDFKKQGLACIQYANGARHNIKEYAEMAVRTAETRAMLMGEGKARQELGETLVQISKHGTACPLCVPFESKVLIDDVYSGGTWENSKDKYERVPKAKRAGVRLMSEAMKQGLYHPRCRHGLGTFYVDLLDEPIKATPPKAPEKTAEEIAAEQAAAKAAKEAAQAAEKQNKFKQLYSLSMRDTLTPDDMAKITALEDDLMMGGNLEEYEAWAAAKQAQTEAAYEDAYKWYGKDYNALTTAEQAEYDKAYNALFDTDINMTPQKQRQKFEQWAANKAKLEAEARLAKIKEDTEKLYKALYAGQTGPDVDALKQAILDDQEMLDAYNAMTEPLYDAAKAELDAKKAYLKQAKQALTDAETAEKTAEKAADDAKKAAKDAADDVANGWLPNYDKAYFNKFGKYPIHTDPNYLSNKQAWRNAKYVSGGDPDAVIIQMADSDLTNTELKKLAMDKEAADKAAELKVKKAEKKAAKKAADQAQQEADAAKVDLERTKQTMLELIEDAYSQERKDAALWFDKAHGGFTAADAYFDPPAKLIHNAATKKERDGFYTYTAGSGGHNRPLAGFRKPWSKSGTGWEQQFYVGPKQVWIDFEGKGEQIRGLTTLIEKSTYDDDLWLQSGQGFATIEGFLGIPYGTLSNMTDTELQKFVGHREKMYSFISTAVNEGGGSMFNEKPLKINFYAPQGSQMLYASDVGAFGKGENEMILQRGGTYEITNIYWGIDKTDKNRRKIFVDMEIHPEEGYDLFQQDPNEWTGSRDNYHS